MLLHVAIYIEQINTYNLNKGALQGGAEDLRLEASPSAVANSIGFIISTSLLLINHFLKKSTCKKSMQVCISTCTFPARFGRNDHNTFIAG